MYDTIIIGAGMSGLAAGIRLAYYEQRVCLLERHSTIGGLNSFYRLRGRDYDVGLHAVTNFALPGTKRGPLALLLRQLRFQWEDFPLAPQCGSAIIFAGVELRFTNDPAVLVAEIDRAFPRQRDNFQRLLGRLLDYHDWESAAWRSSTRAVLAETISDPLLAEMLLCPLMWYGNARPHDMDFGPFSILFRSIFLEGLGRPRVGVRLILKNLVRKFRSLGGELRLRSGVERIVVEDGRATGVVLDDGERLEARRVISSAGAAETLRLCDGVAVPPETPDSRLSFVETISILDQPPAALGCDRTVVFFNDSDRFHWQLPEHDLCDLRTGVVCSPNNYAYDPQDGQLPDNVVRVTALAHYDRWAALSEDHYRLEKLRWYDRLVDAAVRFVPDYRARVIDTDMFTPTTIRRFTGHDQGAVYGAAEKHPDGTTPVQHLFLCGTDQGLVGIVGAIISGITIANRHGLKNA